jgi:hypothetical protein
VKRLLWWFFVPCLSLVSASRAQTILEVPFICEWANTPGGCPNGTAYNIYHSANCGPTSVLMVGSKYSNTQPTGNQISDMDLWLYNNWPYAQFVSDPGTGTAYPNPVLNNYLGYGTTTAELAALANAYFGITSSVAFSNWTIPRLQQELSNGYPVIVFVLAQMDLAADDGHYMVLLGMDSQNVYMNDPGLAFGGQRSASDTTPGRAYPLSQFSVAWAANGYSGVSIHPPPFVLNGEFDGSLAAWTLLFGPPFAVYDGTLNASGSLGGSVKTINNVDESSNPSCTANPTIICVTTFPLVQFVPVTPGTQYDYGGKVFIPSGQAASGYGELGVSFWDNNNNFISVGTQGNGNFVTSTGVWTLSSGTVQAPAGAVRARLSPLNGRMGPAGSLQVNFDDIFFQLH